MASRPGDKESMGFHAVHVRPAFCIDKSLQDVKGSTVFFGSLCFVVLKVSMAISDIQTAQHEIFEIVIAW